MKKAFLFLALCLLGAGRAAAAEPVDSVRNVIYMIGDGMGLAHVSMLAVEGGYAPTAFDRAQGIAVADHINHIANTVDGFRSRCAACTEQAQRQKQKCFLHILVQR
jgi:hypothetical protein